MKDLKSRQDSKILAMAYILCFIVAAIGDSDFLPSAAKVATLGAVGIAFVIFLVYADFTNLKTVCGFSVVYGIWISVILVYSMIIWICNLESIPYIARGCSKVAYQFIVIIVGAAAAYMFGEKAIHYTFYGLVLGNLAIALLYFPRYGLSEVIASVTQFVVGMGDATGYMRRLEIHDITFTYGFFLIYFIFFDKITPKGRKVLNIIVAALFFYIGFKRIAIGSFILVFVVGIVLKFLTSRTQKGVMKILLVGMALFAIGYLVFIKYDVFMRVMSEFDIDVKGRDVLYDHIDKYYRFSPTFFGYGFEYVHIMMLEIAESGGSQFNGMIDIHNDFMRVYIEMGVYGFLAWLYYTLIFQFNWIKTKFNGDVLQLFFLCEAYAFVTYMTDNTLFYFFTGMVLRMVPLCYALHIDSDEKSSEKLVVMNDREKKRFEIFSRRGQKRVTLYRKKTKN